MSNKKNHGALKYMAIVAGAFATTFYISGEIAYHFVLSRRGLNGPIATAVQDKERKSIQENEYRANLERILHEGTDWFESFPKEKLETENRNGDILHADLIKPEKESNIYVLCIHGYTSAPKFMGIYANKFRELGYNVVLPSLRGHADSEEEFISMGWKDRLDVVDWINYIVKEHPDCEIVLHGVSMGAATTMMALGEELPSNVKAAIEDCGYTNAWDVIKHKMSKMKIPDFPFLYSADGINRMRENFSLKEASCTEQLKKCITPLLFIHGEADDFVPYSMLDIVYEAADKCEKEKLSVPDAPHARSVCAHPDLYWNTIINFLKKYI